MNINDLFNHSNETEKYIFDTVKYIEHLIAEFGVQHPLVSKTVKELVDYLQLAIDNGIHFSENFAIGLSRYFEIWMARRDKAEERREHLEFLWEQSLIEEKTSSTSNESWFGSILSGIFVFGVGAFLYQCFREKDPVQVLHHHSGSITDNININHSGYVTENINIRLNKF